MQARPHLGDPKVPAGAIAPPLPYGAVASIGNSMRHMQVSDGR